MSAAIRKWMERVNNFLDRNVLPWPVRFLTFRFVILAKIALLIPLVVYANRTQMRHNPLVSTVRGDLVPHTDE
jgi:hypothetical protein